MFENAKAMFETASTLKNRASLTPPKRGRNGSTTRGRYRTRPRSAGKAERGLRRPRAVIARAQGMEKAEDSGVSEARSPIWKSEAPRNRARPVVKAPRVIAMCTVAKAPSMIESLIPRF